MTPLAYSVRSRSSRTTLALCFLSFERAAGSSLDIKRTPSYEAIAHWAKVAPDRTVLIYTEIPWKVQAGKLLKRRVEPSDWKLINYKDFYDRVLRRDICVAPSWRAHYSTQGRLPGHCAVPSRQSHRLYGHDFRTTSNRMCCSVREPKCFWRASGLGQDDAVARSGRFVRFVFQILAWIPCCPKREQKLVWLDGPPA
jgi:hypothetical protein